LIIDNLKRIVSLANNFIYVNINNELTTN